MKILKESNNIRDCRQVRNNRDKAGEFLITGIIIIIGILIFMAYLNFVTYRGELSGEHILFVKMDGSTGSVQKIDNKYLKLPASIKNTGNLSYGFYTVRYDIQKVKEKDGFLTLEGKMKGYRESGLNGMRRYILEIFDEIFITEENLYAFSRATIMGEKAEVSKDMNDRFKYTGMAHLVVISGSHISLVIVWMVRFLDIMNFRYRLKYIIALIVLSLYCTLIGMSPGILRAYIMGAMMILARILFEREDSSKSLLVSLIVILVLNPYSVFDISMQLSYAAVTAIIFIYPSAEKVCEGLLLYRMKEGIIKESVKLLLLSLVIQITSIPLFLYYFKKLPLFSFLLNIVGVPIGTVLVEALFGITLLNIVQMKFLNFILVPVIEVIYDAFEGFVYFGNRIPLLQISIGGRKDIISVIIYYGVLVMVKMYIDSLDVKQDRGNYS